MRQLYSGAKSSTQASVADVPSWLNCPARLVWVILAAMLISGDTEAVGIRTLTCTMSPTLAPAQNCQASDDDAFAAFAAALTVTDWMRFSGLRKTSASQFARSTSELPALYGLVASSVRYPVTWYGWSPNCCALAASIAATVVEPMTPDGTVTVWVSSWVIWMSLTTLELS